MNSLKAWLHGLLAAAIGAAASTASATLSMPGTFNLYSKLGLINLGKLSLPSAAVAAFLYLKQSPLPSFTQTVTQTKTETVEVTPETKP